MTKSIRIIAITVLVLFTSIVSAGEGELDCSVTVEKMNPYNGVIGEVLSVEDEPNTDPVIMDGKGVRASFSYLLPNGYVGWTWSVFEEGGIIKTGQKFFWIPANKQVREAFPDQDRQVPIVMGDECRPIQVDISLPAKEIGGL